MIHGIIVLVGIVIGLLVGATLGFFIGLFPPVVSLFNDLFSASHSGDFFSGRLNAVVYTLPLLALVGSIVGGWLGHRFS